MTRRVLYVFLALWMTCCALSPTAQEISGCKEACGSHGVKSIVGGGCDTKVGFESWRGSCTCNDPVGAAPAPEGAP